MKLSDAMVLGSMTMRMEAGNWDSCALGCAANAVGIEAVDPSKGITLAAEGRIGGIRAAWPWLDEAAWGFLPAWVWDFDVPSPVGFLYMVVITSTFDWNVCDWKLRRRTPVTFEQLVQWVRSVEPECGECNRFECSCAAGDHEPLEEAEILRLAVTA